MREEKKLEFSIHNDDKGSLTVIEALKNVPFEIKRIFYITGTKSDIVRGKHSNRKSEMVFINVAGSAKIRVHNGKSEQVYLLDKPNEGLYIPQMLWREMYDFSADCVMLTLCSELYDSEEYIRDFDAFLKEVGA